MLGIETYPQGAADVQSYSKGDAVLDICLMKTEGVKSLMPLQVSIYRHTEYDGMSSLPYTGYLKISIGYVNECGGCSPLCVAHYPKNSPSAARTKEALDKALDELEAEFDIWTLGVWKAKLHAALNYISAEFSLEAYPQGVNPSSPALRWFRFATLHGDARHALDVVKLAYESMNVFKYDPDKGYLVEYKVQDSHEQ